MSLNIAVFVPEGITIVSDTLAFLKTNGDDGFPSSAQRTFCIDNRYILSFTGCNYINGMPYGYYVNSFLSTYHSVTIKSTFEFSDLFRKFINNHIPNDDVPIYIAGYDEIENRREAFLYLIDKGKIIRLNYDDKGAQFLYNYHSIGNSLWINKLILPTTYSDEFNKQDEKFQAACIDFSKYSLMAAIDFAHFLLSTTYKMDSFAQINPTVNTQYTTAIITPWEDAKILS